MRQIILTSISIVLIGLGIIGLIIPVIPGVLFLAIAAVLLASAYPAVRARLKRHPRFNRLFQRLDHADNLSWLARGKLTFWAILESVMPGKDHLNR